MCCFIYGQVSGSLEQALEKDWETQNLMAEETRDQGPWNVISVNVATSVKDTILLYPFVQSYQ